MSHTTEKLNYLQGTKDEIKAALIEKGQAVADTDTFRSYAAKIRSIPPSTVVEPVLETLTVTENGTYVPGEGVDGFSSITVNVDQGTSPDVRYVTFRNESTGEEYVKAVATGDDCVDVVAKGLWTRPTKESDEQYHYTFYGWGAEDGGAADSTILQNITENKTVYAIFSKTLRTYTITYLDEDGETVLKTETLAYGAMPGANYAPTKDGSVFSGWDKELTTVTGDATYTAVWTEVIGGSCGTNANWMYDANTGALTIYGTGAVTSDGWADYSSVITSVSIADGITSLPNGAFQNHSALTAVHITDLTAWCKFTFGSYTANPLYFAQNLYLNGELVTDLVIPDGITTINDYAFYSCKTLTSVAIPASVKSIVGYAFRYCTGLTAVYITDLTAWCNLSIPYTNPLEYAQNLYLNGELVTDLVIPDGITTINDKVFNSCINLTSLAVPDSVTSIGNNAFQNCANLKSVTFGSGLAKIGYSAFYLSGLTSAIFAVTEGWWYAISQYATSGTSISSSTLASPSNAATLLTTTYRSHYWNRS